MKSSFPLAVALFASLPLATLAQQAVPESPAIWREVTGVINDYTSGTAVPKFTRAHIPGFRVSADGRIALVVEGGGNVGSTPAFTLMMPEKMTQPFLLNPASSNTVTSPTMTRLNVTNTYGTVSLATKNYTDGVAGVSHACMWDDGANPTVVAGEDVYNLKVVVTSNSGTSPNNHTQFFMTPIRITVSNPKTVNASIRLIEKTGPTTGTPVLTSFAGSAFEPVVCGDGRLLMVRVGSGAMGWTDPVSGLVHAPQGVDIVYSYYTGGTTADASQWTTLIPISHAPYDSRINTKFGFAMAPFRDPEGTLIPDGEDIGGSYPWMDRDAKNLFFEAVYDQLHYGVSGDYNHARYPQTAAPEEPADYTQGEDGGKHQGVSFVGLWSHGKVVTIDNLNNDMDYAIGQGDSSVVVGATSTGPQQRLVSLFQANTGPLGTESGWLRLGYGRSTKKMPAGENDNANIIDSIENLFNYRKYAAPLSLRDVAWTMSNSKQTDDLAFDDYLDPDALIIANMAGLITFPSNSTSSSGGNNFKHWSGWNTTTHLFDQPTKLQNAATATTDMWITPKNGLVLGNGRLEPAAAGGVHGKGFSMSGTSGLEFTIDAQPQSVASKDWYIGIFADCRFTNDTTERQLLTFPDGTGVRLYGRSQILYTDAGGNVINRITIPVPNTTAPVSAMDDLVPDTGWAHFALQVKQGGTMVDFYLNGIIYSRWDDAYRSLFQLTPGKLTIGKPTTGGAANGFAGWVDDFKVIAHAVDFETACNHAGGTLIGLPSTYTGEWKTKFADRFPSWAHTEITNRLKNTGETAYPLYANYYNYRADNAAQRFSIPSGTISMRQSIHFPEGPLFHNAPRPDTATNAFCITCHHETAKGGLDMTALELDTTFIAANDPRRQPSQPPAKLYGRLPAGLVDSTGLPAATTDTAPSGQSVDPLMLASFTNSTAVQTFTVVNATTHQDLMTLTSGAVIDPAKLGTTNLTIRANLNSAQGSVTLQYDATPTNLKSKPPYTAFGSDSNPWVGAVLAPGSHTIKATPQYGSLVTLTFTVAGNTSRVVADYRDDFKAGSPLPGWTYLWNALGPITSAANYRQLNWSPTINRYSVNGFPVSPDNSSTLFPYGGLTSSGGHPGRGVNQSAVYDRFPIAAYTAKQAGYYGIGSSFVTSSTAASNGGQVIIYTETNAGATFTQKFNSTYLGGATLTFDQNVGQLQAGDTIYVCVGPNTNDGSDSFTMDFSIVFKETGNPLP
jgi:hypothetical protein